MPNPFHNPYHFIPLVKPKPYDRRVPYDVVRDFEPAHFWHDRYASTDGKGRPVRSGRIVCSLTTVSPTFVGSAGRRAGTKGTPRPTGSPATDDGFLIDGKPAIPESTLKGMISHIAEVASRSGARVLSDPMMSFRRRMGLPERNGPLSALGMIIRRRENNKESFWLLPLTLPTLVADQKGNFPVPPQYLPLFPAPMFRVYLNQYQAGTENDTPSGELAGKESFTPGSTAPWYYMNLPAVGYTPEKKIAAAGLRLKGNGQYAVAVDRTHGSALSTKDDPGLQRGILRVLGRHGMKPKKHELFLPVPPTIDQILDGTVTTGLVRVSDGAMERWKDLATDRHEHDELDPPELPYLPKGYGARTKPFLPEHGDVVYFRPNQNGTSIAEIAYSSVWRGRVEDDSGERETLWDFVDREQRPMNVGRGTVSAAELVFGFVEPRAPSAEPEQEPDETLRLRGRVRSSHATVDGDAPAGEFFEPAATLRILSAPKVPVPVMRFRRRDGKNPQTLIEKHELNPQEHEPQGFVVYLHDKDAIGSVSGNANPPWMTRRTAADADFRPDLHIRIRPWKKGLTLRFHIDFTNLDEYELGMLLYALEPDPTFHHKVGMGKPLGLGTVKIRVEGVFAVDRGKRYRETNLHDRKRYHAMWTAGDGAAQNKAVASEIAGTVENPDTIDVTDIRSRFKKTVDSATHRALRVLGDPAKIVLPVHYPRLEKADPERELYEWFVANEVGIKNTVTKQWIVAPQKKALRPVTDDSVPTLERYTKNQ